MEDTAPRLSPPPKPAVLEVSTPKHAVPEVSLVCDSETSLTWQVSQHNTAATNTHQPQDITAKWRLPHPARNLHSAPKPITAPSQPIEKGVNHISPLAVPRLPGSQRDILGQRGAQSTASLYGSPPIQRNKEYNPQIYSPATRHSARGIQEAQDGPQRDTPVGNSNPIFSAGSLSYPSGVPKGSLSTNSNSAVLTGKDAKYDPVNTCVGTVPSAGKDVRQGPVDTYVGIMPSAVKDKQDPFITHTGTVPAAANSDRCMEEINATANPPTRSHSSPTPQGILKPSYIRPTYPPSSSITHNDIFTGRSSPYLQQGKPSAHLQDHTQHPGAHNNTDWSSPTSSLPTPPTNPYNPLGPEYNFGQTWGHNSPALPMVRLPHSPADPVVYALIEDQKQQILRLSKDLHKIMERQAKEEEEEERGIPKVPNQTPKISQKQDISSHDASTQTPVIEKPALQTVGVNTDISWPDLIASLRQLEEKEVEEEEATDPRHPRGQDRNEWLRDIRMGHDCPPSHDCLTGQRGSLEPDCETITDNSQGGRESSSGQDWGQARSPLTFPNTTDPTRVDAGDGWQEDLSVRDSGTATGTTFYHNVLTNVHQILQHTSSSQEQKKQQQQLTPSQGLVARVGAGEGSGGPDPQIEAVRKQLLNFGISFLDPATLTPSHSRPMVDSLYLPGLHNTVSLYQNSISTTAHIHHHPSDAMAAKYLTDSQLAAIAAASPAMKKHGDKSGSAPPPSVLPSRQHLYRLNNDNDNSVSMATQKFLEKYGLQED